MMQAVPQAGGFNDGLVVAAAVSSTLAPAAMAHHLRQVDPRAALCFAQAMYERAAWANEEWGDYWAAVVRSV